MTPRAKKDAMTRVNPTTKKTYAATWVKSIWKHSALGWWSIAFSKLCHVGQNRGERENIVTNRRADKGHDDDDMDSRQEANGTEGLDDSC